MLTDCLQISPRKRSINFLKFLQHFQQITREEGGGVGEETRSAQPGFVAAELVLVGRREIAVAAVGQFDEKRMRKRALVFDFQTNKKFTNSR